MNATNANETTKCLQPWKSYRLKSRLPIQRRLIGNWTSPNNSNLTGSWKTTKVCSTGREIYYRRRMLLNIASILAMQHQSNNGFIVPPKSNKPSSKMRSVACWWMGSSEKRKVHGRHQWYYSPTHLVAANHERGAPNFGFTYKHIKSHDQRVPNLP